jgi:hypothetical protein
MIGDMAMRICFFGDSIVNGTGDDAYLGWWVASARQRDDAAST